MLFLQRWLFLHSFSYEIIGKIIGRGGEVITQIQQRSGAKVQIEQNVPEGIFRLVMFYLSFFNCFAPFIILILIGFMCVCVMTLFLSFCVIYLNKHHQTLLSSILSIHIIYALFIGQPCKVNMSGTHQQLAIATQLVQEAMVGVKSQGGMGMQQQYGGT